MFTKMMETIGRMGELVYQTNVRLEALGLKVNKIYVTPLKGGCNVELTSCDGNLMLVTGLVLPDGEVCWDEQDGWQVLKDNLNHAEGLLQEERAKLTSALKKLEV